MSTCRRITVIQIKALFFFSFMQFISRHKDQTGSSLVECLTPDRGAVGSSLTGASAMCP